MMNRIYNKVIKKNKKVFGDIARSQTEEIIKNNIGRVCFALILGWFVNIAIVYLSSRENNLFKEISMSIITIPLFFGISFAIINSYI
jgi:hypothetical protein